MDTLVEALEDVISARLRRWPDTWVGYHWPGYTYEHTIRVRDLALELARREDADAEVVHLAALLHDVRKDAGRDHAQIGAEEARAILQEHHVDSDTCDRVCDAIASHAGDNTPNSPIESLCLGDADLIDANFGLVATWRFVTIRAGHDQPWPETVAAMQEWLPKKNAFLKSLLTRSGREIARQRAARMQVFCDELLDLVASRPAKNGFGLLDFVSFVHDDRGEHLLTDQLDLIQKLCAENHSDGMVEIICRSMLHEIAGLH